jgi:hypothetical protein
LDTAAAWACLGPAERDRATRNAGNVRGQIIDRDHLRRHTIEKLLGERAFILALCRYIEPLFGETDQPDLPDYIDYEDDASACIPEAFAYVIGRAIEELMKTVRHEQHH